MNFLAHIALSENRPDLTLGNFIADFIKGNPEGKYRSEVVEGIFLHRKIDFFTDHNDIVSQSKNRLWSNYRHYSSVIVDMYFDHFLSKNWEDYSTIPLEQYVQNFYDLLHANHEWLPSKVIKMMPYMISQNWLVNYRELEGLKKALTGLSRRARFESGMENAVDDLEKNYSLFEQEFRSFYPVLQEYTRTQLE